MNFEIDSNIWIVRPVEDHIRYMNPFTFDMSELMDF